MVASPRRTTFPLSLTNFNMVRGVSNYNMSSGDRLRDGRDDGGQRFSFEDPDFESYLRALKRHGCNLLVTGEAGRDVFAAMTSRLMGAPSGRRQRLLALTNARASDAGSLLPGEVGVEDPDVTVFEYSTSTRAAATEAPSPHASSPTREEIFEFQDDICDAIDAESDELAPGELRVGVVNLCPFVHEYETETVAEFTRTVGSAVLRARGMAHYCLPTSAHKPIVADLQPEFDARIEIRQGNAGLPMHRWYVPEYDITTPWVEI